MTQTASVEMTAARMIFGSTFEAALDYGAVDLAVFPTGSDCRTPLCPHGCKDASTDPAEIARLWSAQPWANVSLATGSPSGVFAIDVDVKDGKDGLAALEGLQGRHGPLPETWLTLTPSGGRHVFFLQPVDRILRNRVSVEGSGLDVRSTGASVALPPSRKPSGVYSWLVDPLMVRAAVAPPWLLDFIDPPAVARPAAPPLRFTSTDRTARYVAAAVDAESAELSSMKPGSGRNLRLFQAAANLGEFVGAGLLPQRLAEDAMEAAALACGLTQEDGSLAVRATIASGMRRGLEHPRSVA
jgi:hypothetical protein